MLACALGEHMDMLGEEGSGLTPVAVREGADEGADCFDHTANYDGCLPPEVVRKERPG